MMSKRKWTLEEEMQLREGYNRFGSHWASIAVTISGRTQAQCSSKWRNTLCPNLKKGPFSPDEDAAIRNHVREHGERDWQNILPNRSGKQCRERWRNNLDPKIEKRALTPEEEQFVIEHHHKGWTWVEIARHIAGGAIPADTIKNRCRQIKKKLQPMVGVRAELIVPPEIPAIVPFQDQPEREPPPPAPPAPEPASEPASALQTAAPPKERKEPVGEQDPMNDNVFFADFLDSGFPFISWDNSCEELFK